MTTITTIRQIAAQEQHLPALVEHPAIQEAASFIRAGQLVAFPTETVYGLGGNALDAEAIARIFEAKGRPTNDPVIVHIADLSQLAQVLDPHADYLNPQYMASLTALWPAPLTLVLPRHPSIPANVSAGLDTVGVRMPLHPIALALIQAAGVPIAAPSANRFAHTSPTLAQHVYLDLAGQIPLILDGGPTPVGVESTIIDLHSSPPRLLRPGGISLEQLTTLMPDLVLIEKYVTSEDEVLDAPGMLVRHYAPRARLIVLDGELPAIQVALQDKTLRWKEQGYDVGWLIAEEDRPALVGVSVPHVVLGSLDNLEQVARHLFAGLRYLDEQGVTVILARNFPATGLGLAIRDRLFRAAEGRILHV